MKSFLFIPGNNPKMLSQMDFLGADSILIDLEDAVAASEKDAARILVRNAIKYVPHSTCVGVRINSLDTPFWKKDLEEILPLGVDYIVLPKVSCAEDIKKLHAVMGSVISETKLPKVIALIETALGVENAYSIAASDPLLEALFLGAEDLTADLCAKRTDGGAEILYSRGRLVCAARACGKEVYDTPYTDIADTAGLRSDAETAKHMGFTGKACINPAQIDIVNAVFAPTPEETEYALKVIRADKEGRKKGLGAVSLDGKMIDAPIVARARYTLRLAGIDPEGGGD